MARESALAREGVVGERGDCGAFASNFFCRTEGENVSMGGGLLGCVLLSLGSGVRDRGELLPPHCDIKLRTAERTHGQRCNNWNGRGLDKADACWQYHGTGAAQQRKQFHQREGHSPRFVRGMIVRRFGRSGNCFSPSFGSQGHSPRWCVVQGRDGTVVQSLQRGRRYYCTV